VLRAVVLTQYRRVTDRRTDRRADGIAAASTALAMRALRRAVKTEKIRNKSSAVAEIGDRLATKDMGRKRGGAAAVVPLFWGRWVPI